MKTIAILVLALLAAAVLADDPPKYIWTARFKAPKCDWSQVTDVNAIIPIIGCVESACITVGDTSSLIHCGADLPDGKNSPPGSLIVTFTQANCAGNALTKNWRTSACLSAGLVGSESIIASRGIEKSLANYRLFLKWR